MLPLRELLLTEDKEKDHMAETEKTPSNESNGSGTRRRGGGSLNRVLLVGNLGADPELRHTPSGTAVCNLRVATNESFTDRSGQVRETTTWHRIVAWARQAEVCAEFLRKGSHILVDGSLRDRSYEDREGQRRNVVEIHARHVQFLDRRPSQPEGTPPPVDEADEAAP